MMKLYGTVRVSVDPPDVLNDLSSMWKQMVIGQTGARIVDGSWEVDCAGGSHEWTAQEREATSKEIEIDESFKKIIGLLQASAVGRCP